MWWSLVGVTLRLIAVNQYPDDTTATGTSSPDCALALAAIIAASASSSSNLIGANMTVLSRLTNQLLECSNGKSEGDPYAMHKNATMSAAWVLGMVLVSHTDLLTHTLTHTLPHAHAHPPTHAHTHSHTPSLTHSLTYTRTHAHTRVAPGCLEWFW